MAVLEQVAERTGLREGLALCVAVRERERLGVWVAVTLQLTVEVARSVALGEVVRVNGRPQTQD